MKEINSLPILMVHYPLPKKQRFSRPWKVAQSRKGFEMQQGANRATEFAFMRIVEFAKGQLKPGTTYIERDFREAEEVYCCTMHSFLSPTFYISLHCAYDYTYTVDYCFFR